MLIVYTLCYPLPGNMSACALTIDAAVQRLSVNVWIGLDSRGWILI